MKMTLLTVGKTDVPWVREGLDTYVSRLRHYIPFSVKELPELKNAAALTREQIREKEGAALLGSLSDGDYLILLDDKGTEMTSPQWAASLQDLLLHQGRSLVFAVGGAYGFSPAVYARASRKLSLSQMTFSHQMVRVIFAEQLYRAFTILRGEPYHHE